MRKKYTGMVFKKDPSITARTQEEKEVLEHLERKVHNNDLEDDFFVLAQGLREDVDECSDESSIFEISNEESCAVHNGEEQKEAYVAEEKQEETESLKKDCFASLVDQVNMQGSRGFGMLSNFFDRKKKQPKKQRRINTSIEACNSILNRMGAYVPQDYEQESEPEKKTKKQKIEEKCDNWEDEQTNTGANQPNII